MPIGRSGTGSVGTAILLFRHLDAPLDLAHGVEVFRDSRAIARAERSLEPREILVDAIEQAALPLHPIEPLFGRAAFAEQPLEHHARVVLDRQRSRGRLPRYGVHVRAAVARLALAAEHEIDLRRDHLHRRQHASPCRAAPPRSGRPSCRVGCRRLRSSSGARRSSHVAHARVCSPLPSPSDSPCFCARPLTIVKRSRYGASGVRIGESSKSVPGPFRRPVVEAVVHRDAVRDVDEARSGTPDFAALLQRRRKRRHHGVEQRQRKRGAQAPRRNVRRGNAILVMIMTAASASETERLLTTPGDETTHGSSVTRRVARDLPHRRHVVRTPGRGRAHTSAFSP